MKLLVNLAAASVAAALLVGCASTTGEKPAAATSLAPAVVPTAPAAGAGPEEKYSWFTGAVERNRVDVVTKMLNEGFDPNVLIDGQDPVLVRAIRLEYWGVVKALMASPKINVDMASDVGETALMLAAYKGKMDLVQELLARGATINRIGGWTPLHYAATTGKNDVVKLLLAKGARVNVQTAAGVTPLYMAARLPSRDVANTLLAAGAMKDLCNDQGDSPAAAAKRAGDEKLAQQLAIKACAKPETALIVIPSAVRKAAGDAAQ